MHLVSSYMDTQLEAPLDQPDARTFTSRYMAKIGHDLPRNKGPVIVCQSANPPHYCLALTGDSLPADYEEIPRVRIILLYNRWHLKTKYKFGYIFSLSGPKQHVSHSSTFSVYCKYQRSRNARSGQFGNVRR